MIPLYKPYMPDNLTELQQILYSGQLSYGEYTKHFEEKLKSYFDTPLLLVVSSYQLAVEVILAALNIEKGEEILVSPMACLASTQPYYAYGAKIKWGDIDPSTGTLDPEAVEKQITCKTKIVVHNHFCGYPGYINEINRIGKDNGIVVIDDGIESFGTKYQGNLIGNCGTDLTIFSFSAVRLPNTIEGAAIIFRDKELYEIASLVRDFGIDRTTFRDELGEIRQESDIILKGYGAMMSNLNGYIGCCQMDKLEELHKLQRENAKKWNERLQSVYKTINCSHGLPNYWVFGILASKKKEAICHFRKQGYWASGVHIPNNIYSVFERQETLPGVKEFYEHFVALPCGWWF